MKSLWGFSLWRATSALVVCTFACGLRAQHPDLQPLDLQAPSVVEHYDTIDITYVVANVGDAPAEGYWEDDIRLSVGTNLTDLTTTLERVPNPGPLAPGEAYTGTVTHAVMAFDGLKPYYLQIVADRRAFLYETETNRANNLLARPIEIQGVDLELTRFESPTTLGFDDPFEVSWFASNAGTATAEPDWTDRLYLSEDEYFVGSNDMTWEAGVQSNALPPGASYAGRATVTIPAGSRAPGDYFLILVCNRDGDVREVQGQYNVITRPVLLTDSEPFSISGLSTCLGTVPGYLHFDPPPDTDRVEYTFDGAYVGTAYGPEFEATWNAFPFLAAAGLGREDARIGASAFAENGNLVGVSMSERIDDMLNAMPCTVEIKEPRPGHTMYTETDPSNGDTLVIRVEALRLDYLYQGQGTATFRHPGTTQPMGDLADVGDAWEPAAPVHVYIDGDLVHTSTEVPSDPFFPYHEFEYTTTNMNLGEHRLSVYLEPPGDYTPVWDTRRFDVDFAQPSFSMGRDVFAHDTYFEVEVEIINSGAGSANLERLVEPMTGFQACNVTATLPFTNAASVFSYAGEENLLTIEFGGETLGPDATCTISYDAVPILLRSDCDYVFGSDDGTIEFLDPYGAPGSEDWHETTTVTSPWHGRRDLEDAVDDALGMSNYLLLTDPVNLTAAYGTRAGNAILSDMAELATLRGGVLAYYHALGMIRTDYRPGKFAAIGRVFEPDKAGEQLIIASPPEDHVDAYFENFEKKIVDSDGDEKRDAVIVHELRGGDALAVGNVTLSYSSGTDVHANEEIILAWGSERTHSFDVGLLYIYRYEYDTDPALAGQFQVQEVASSFTAGDLLLTGDVFIDATGTPRDEIIIVHTDGAVDVKELGSTARWTTFDTNYREGDLFAVGDLLGDAGLELVVGRVDADELEIYVPGEYAYHWTGTEGVYLLQYDLYQWTAQTIGAADDLVVGDVCGDSYDEIVLADAANDRVMLIGYDAGALEVIDSFDLEYGEQDDLLAGNLASSGKKQMLALRGSDYQGQPAGTVEMINFASGEAPGDRWALDDLVNVGGHWASRLVSNWTDNGHLLIVGETEILPAFTAYWEIEGFVNDDVRHTDRNYASTQIASDYDVPELAVGRIPGNTAERVRKALRNAIEVAQDPTFLRNDSGYCISGTDDVNADRFILLRDDIGDTLTAHGFSVLEKHTPGVTNFMTQAEDRDVIFFAGHGNLRVCCGIRAGEVKDMFNAGTRRPLVFAASCLTGKYPGGTTIAEEFLWRGAAAYVGATELTYSFGYECNGWAPGLAEAFISRLAADRTLGRSLVLAKQHRLSGVVNSEDEDWDKNRYTCATYHLYGDPALTMEWAGGDAGASLMLPGQAASDPVPGPVSTLEMNVPDYVVYTNQGIHRVEIPGQEQVTVYGWPAVPFYAEAVHFPKGYVVQDVTMNARSAPRLDTGLNLEPVVPYTNSAASQAPVQADNSGWWPDRDFAWSVSKKSDGSSLLAVKAFPFFYHTDTLESHFHTNYTFGIDYAESSVEVLALVPGRRVYSPEAVVTAAIYLQNADTNAITVDLEASVRYETGAVVAQLPVRRLTDLRGLGWCRLQWDSDQSPGGEYTLVVAVRDPVGTLLDQADCVFQLGGADGRISELSVTPPTYDVGDDVQLSATFENTGTTSLDGTLVIAVFDALGDLEIEFRDVFTGLAPGTAAPFAFLWTAASLAPADCRIVAYAQFAGRTTALSIVPAVTEPPLRWDWCEVVSGGIHLRWPSVEGRHYRIEYTPNLSAVPFTAIATNLPATPPHNQVTNTVYDLHGYYRLAEE